MLPHSCFWYPFFALKAWSSKCDTATLLRRKPSCISNLHYSDFMGSDIKTPLQVITKIKQKKGYFTCCSLSPGPAASLEASSYHITEFVISPTLLPSLPSTQFSHFQTEEIAKQLFPHMEAIPQFWFWSSQDLIPAFINLWWSSPSHHIKNRNTLLSGMTIAAS